MDEQRAERIALLKNHPAWDDLCAELDEQRTAFVTKLADRISRSQDPVDQREIDEERGFYRASRFFQDLPDRAEKALKALEQRRIEGSDD